MKEKKKKEKPKVNLILSHSNHTFEKLDPQINGPQAFGHTRCTLQKSAFLKCEEGSNSRFNQIGPWVFGPWTLV